MTRFLGTAFAAIHAPKQPRDFAAWVLGHGFRGVQPGPAPLPIDWSGLFRTSRDTGLRFAPALHLAAPAQPFEDRADRNLASRSGGDREVAAAQVRAAAERAAALGIATVLIQPGRIATPGDEEPFDVTAERVDFDAARWVARRAQARDAALDVACRSLHGLARANPDLHLGLVAGRGSDSLLDPGTLTAILEDLPGLRLGYWHDAAVVAARAARLGEEQGAWLEAGSRHWIGLSAGDWAEGSTALPPGAGLADYPLIASELRSAAGETVVVADLDPALPPTELPGVHAFLAKCGL